VKKYLKNLKKIELLVFCFIYKNFLFFSSARVNNCMSDELSIRKAKRIVKKFCEPPYDLEEARLKEAAWKVLQECKCGSFEWENEEEEESPKSKTPKENQSVFESVKKYAAETTKNIQSLGAAGAVAFSSAAYFQTIEAYETTREIGIVIQRVEADYGESLFGYIVGAIKGEEESTQSEETSTESEETSTEESVEEAESDNKQEQPKDNNENERGEETKNEEGDDKVNRSETTSDIQTNPVQSETNDSGYIDNDLDPIKPHSMVDDIFNDPPVITPIDAIVVSPAGPARTVSPVK
jgi:hypothetical protein